METKCLIKILQIDEIETEIPKPSLCVSSTWSNNSTIVSLIIDGKSYSVYARELKQAVAFCLRSL